MIETFQALVDKLFGFLFSPRFRHRFETAILYLGISGFVIHLLIILLHDLGWINVGKASGELFISPISAIYTPFSFILIYEVYLLIFHLPSSFTISIAKQYEIISLIIIRRIFKDISKLDISEQWTESYRNLLLGVDMLCILFLFLLIFFFYRLREQKPNLETPSNINTFVTIKKAIAVILVPLLFGLALYSLGNWANELQRFNLGEIQELSDINKVFYNEFFTLLILFDVFLLMVSFRFTDNYSQLIRNSGFVISTILIRLSFSASGLFNPLLITAGVIFGVLILWLYNKVGRLADVEEPNNTSEN
ncbi:MAG: hypothetical protein H6573_14600 [Lewinellaceae bacterium]|nr:hypothetical protein [Phaeodactylibacter sp.]MCB9348717.1 hypothetical protein [Lewinellaceae bacterium]